MAMLADHTPRNFVLDQSDAELPIGELILLIGDSDAGIVSEPGSTADIII